MDFYGDYHTHTKYSDGRTDVSYNIRSAVLKGLKELAFTDHGFGNPMGALTPEAFVKQRAEIKALESLYPELTVFHGIEADIIGLDGTIDITDEQLRDIDILIAGYHSFAKAVSFSDWRKLFGTTFLGFVFPVSKATVARNTQAYISMVKRYPIDIVAHINHLCKVDCYEVAKACADYGTVIEINAKHIDMAHEDFEKMLTTDVKFVANSDAHREGAIGSFEKITEYLSHHPSFNYARLVNYQKKPVFPRKKERQD